LSSCAAADAARTISRSPSWLVKNISLTTITSNSTAGLDVKLLLQNTTTNGEEGAS